MNTKIKVLLMGAVFTAFTMTSVVAKADTSAQLNCAITEDGSAGPGTSFPIRIERPTAGAQNPISGDGVGYHFDVWLIPSPDTGTLFLQLHLSGSTGYGAISQGVLQTGDDSKGSVAVILDAQGHRTTLVCGFGEEATINHSFK